MRLAPSGERRRTSVLVWLLAISRRQNHRLVYYDALAGNLSSISSSCPAPHPESVILFYCGQAGTASNTGQAKWPALCKLAINQSPRREDDNCRWLLALQVLPLMRDAYTACYCGLVCDFASAAGSASFFFLN